MEDLSAYVKGPSLLDEGTNPSLVRLNVTHSNLKQHSRELRLDLHSSVDSIKEKLGRQCGTSPDMMLLELYDSEDVHVTTMSEGLRSLGFYSPFDGYRIHIVDLDPTSLSAGGWLEDISQVEKFTLSEEEYNKRTDTFRKFKEKKRAQDPSWLNASKATTGDEYMSEIASLIKVGERCEVEGGEKRGVVMYVGAVEGLPAGYWVGVKYDEPVGKHNGTFKGRQYFSCPDGYGAMLRPDKVKVGDYPEVDPFDEL